jgi:hypothetical protein
MFVPNFEKFICGDVCPVVGCCVEVGGVVDVSEIFGVSMFRAI